ncbi:UNVERIFIED_CONTAM: hypothetical protein DES50_103197 [Williamsia faeni]
MTDPAIFDQVTNTGSSKNDALTRNLLVVVEIAAILLTAVAIYDIANGEHSLSVWVAIVCWPIVAIFNGVKLFKLLQNH